MLESYTPSEDPMEEREPEIRPSLRERFETEKNRVKRLRDAGGNITDVPKPSIDPVTDDEYRSEAAPLTHSVSTAVLPSEQEFPKYLEDMYPAGKKFCLVALPFTDACLDGEVVAEETWQQWLFQGGYLRWLLTDPENEDLTLGFGGKHGYFFDHLPPSVKKDVDEGGCTFDLQYPYPSGEPGNKEWFAKKIQKALQNLRTILNTPQGEAPRTLHS